MLNRSAPDKVAPSVAAYMALPYARQLIRNQDGSWFAQIVEFVGCMTEGATQVEALANLEEAMEGWLEIHIAEGNAIPEPMAGTHYSGRFLTRVPPTLHRDLARRAEREGVSLNLFVATALARALGQV